MMSRPHRRARHPPFPVVRCRAVPLTHHLDRLVSSNLQCRLIPVPHGQRTPIRRFRGTSSLDSRTPAYRRQLHLEHHRRRHRPGRWTRLPARGSVVRSLREWNPPLAGRADHLPNRLDLPYPNHRRARWRKTPAERSRWVAANPATAADTIHYPALCFQNLLRRPCRCRALHCPKGPFPANRRYPFLPYRRPTIPCRRLRRHQPQREETITRAAALAGVCQRLMRSAIRRMYHLLRTIVLPLAAHSLPIRRHRRPHPRRLLEQEPSRRDALPGRFRRE